MQNPKNNTSAGPHSPTLSDGSKAKRNYAAVNKSNNKDKIQKLRRLDSPTSPTDKNFVQVPSPQYSTLESGKFSPRMGQDKSSISPKGLYPPSIQKYLNGKTNITIKDAVDKLKSPTNKAHKTNLEKMQLLGMLQTQEIETNIMFRKAYSNSPSVSPPRSNSPIESPKMTISPKVEPSSPVGNIVMTFEESSPTMGREYNPQPNNNWNNNNMMQNHGTYNQSQQQQGFYNNPQSQMGGGYNNQNFQGNQGNQGNFGHNPQGYQGMQYNQPQQFNSFNQSQQQPAYFNNNNNNNQGGQGQNQSNVIEEESRDRTTSFLMDGGFNNFGNFGGMGQQRGGVSDTKWMAQNQISQIESLVQGKKTISPGEPSRGLAQLFQKRNSNPENLMRNGPQPLFPQKNQSTGMNGFQQGGGGFNNNMMNNNNQQFGGQNMFQNNNRINSNLFDPAYQAQFNSHQLQQKLFETGMVEQQSGYNNNQNHHQSHHHQGMGDINFEFRFTEDNNTNWPSNNPFDQDKIHEKIEENEFVLDPSAFLGLNTMKEQIDFDMNIVPSNVGFIPDNHFEGLQGNTGGGMDTFHNNNPY